MERFLGRYSTYIYAILRIVSGFVFMLHGAQKFFGFPPSAKAGGQLDAFSTVGGAIELVGGLMILIGLFSAIAAFIASGEMAVAYFMFHQPNGPLPPSNGGDAAILFCFIFLYIASRGSGVWSVESLFRGSRGTDG
jgi:putative oxidoreductase